MSNPNDSQNFRTPAPSPMKTPPNSTASKLSLRLSNSLEMYKKRRSSADVEGLIKSLSELQLPAINECSSPVSGNCSMKLNFDVFEDSIDGYNASLDTSISFLEEVAPTRKVLKRRRETQHLDNSIDTSSEGDLQYADGDNGTNKFDRVNGYKKKRFAKSNSQ